MSLDTRNPRRLPAFRRRAFLLAGADLALQIFQERRYCFIQSALAIPNEAGASFRADTNTAHQANATFQAGASAPGTTYADQCWWDTTNQVLKKRNQANSAWIVIATRDEAFVVSRSSNTILGLSDVGKTFIATGTFTQTVTAAATLADGWYCFYRNDGSGVITIDPNASETIDGGLILTLNSGEGCRIACNGSAFKTQGLAWKVTKRKTADQSVTSSTTLTNDTDLTFPIGANEEWTAEYSCTIGDVLASSGFKCAITVPSGATMNASAVWVTGDGVSMTNQAAGSTTTSGAAMIVVLGTVNSQGIVKLRIWVLNGATAGSVTLQFAQSSSNINPIVMKKGSFLQASRVA